MALPNTVSEFSRKAAQEFLQTVVFVDDRIYENKSGTVHEPSNVTTPKQRKKVTKVEEKKSLTITSTENEEQLDEYSPHAVVNSFAKKKIICSLYQPDRRDKVTPKSEIFPLCIAADVVIVDWDLYGDRGEKALELIDGLINQAVTAVPEQLRLILVYTQEQNLVAIADEIFQKVTSSIGEQFEPLREENGLAFHTENSRLSIIGKTGKERPGTPGEHIVAEKELANVVVNEFAKLASGLLHAVSLLGLAEIRKNSRKILSKFNSSLDPAFLMHRALSLPDEDAANHLVPLLISEIEAVLLDKRDDLIISESLIKDWCYNEWKPGVHVEELLGIDADKQKVATEFCLNGKELKTENLPNSIIKKSIKNGKWTGDLEKLRCIANLLVSDKDSVKNHEFSRLMSSRTFYGKASKSLQLGTIVYLQNKHDIKRYLLCLMPACDSVRLDGTRKFVFAELEESVQDGKNKVSIVLLLKDNPPVELIYKPKSYKLFVAEFKPDKQSKQVLAKPSETGLEIFKDIAEQEFVWADQLKTAHAQRAVEQFARELSRVGLTESEWRRLLE